MYGLPHCLEHFLVITLKLTATAQECMMPFTERSPFDLANMLANAVAVFTIQLVQVCVLKQCFNNKRYFYCQIAVYCPLYTCTSVHFHICVCACISA